MLYIGLDVHKEFCQACVIDESGRALSNERFSSTNEELDRFLNRFQDAKFVLESTGIWEFIYEGIERIIVHCELDLGMRRIEVLRLKTSSFQTGRTNTVLIHGKGRNGGKWRDIEWHPDTPQELEAYLAIRDMEIARAKSKNPDVVVPEDLLIYEADGKLIPYKKSAVDKFLKALGLRTTIEFSNHDLRRTCGRMMYRAGVDIVRIARIFGHSDTKTTMRYLGLDHEEMASAMNQYAQYQRAVVFPKVETIEVSQQKSGPCGI